MLRRFGYQIAGSIGIVIWFGALIYYWHATSDGGYDVGLAAAASYAIPAYGIFVLPFCVAAVGGRLGLVIATPFLATLLCLGVIVLIIHRDLSG